MFWYNRLDIDAWGVAVFLLLEEEDIVCLERVVALVREGSETAILMRDDTVRATGFTPMTLRKRSEKFWRDATQWKEQHRACQRKR